MPPRQSLFRMSRRILFFSVVCPLLPSSIPFQHHILMVEIDDGSDKCHKTNEAHDGEKCC